MGAPKNAGLAFADAATTMKEIDAALAALEARYGPYIAPGPIVYAGFSLGAIQGVRIVSERPSSFPFAVLAEGGSDRFDAATVKRFAGGGGKRLLLFCSTAACEASTKPALRTLERAGIEVRYATAGNVGHLVDQRIIDALIPAFPWVVGGDARWSGLDTGAGFP